MRTLLIDGCEFVVPTDPTTIAGEGNPLDTVSPWWGLGTYQQNALRWLVNHGGTAYASDLTALRALAARGLAVVDEAGRWTATDAGRELHADGQR
jgi:hypothetical protein